MRIILPLALTVLLLSACGSESTNDDTGTRPDAGTSTPPDAGTNPPPTCSASSSYSGPLGGSAKVINPGKSGEALSFTGDLIGGDRLVVSMYSQFGTPGYQTGTFDMASKVKVLSDILTNYSPGVWTADYAAKSGTLNVTSVSGKFSGTITNATFASEKEPGCIVSVPTLTFEGFIQ